jgi:hypothetical protein
MAKIKVKVDQEGGEIRVSFNGDDPIVYRVSKSGYTDVAEEHVDRFLVAVPGASLPEGAVEASDDEAKEE